ncbi:CorA family divalent cation transporter [Nocardioides sp. MH1]|uniref:CorA family divalent cation transporter n=1 Tax=Nocardioides sp. MH1 TaxID=3242490 RepID=UPI0035211D45
MSTIEGGPVELRAGSWRETASRIAAELHHGQRTERMAKVSSLLHAFRSQGGHCDIHDMVQALRDEGVAVRCDPDTISRRDVLDLHVGDGGAVAPGGARGVRVSHWRAGVPGTMVPLDDAAEAAEADQPPGVVRWFEVDPDAGDPAVQAADLLERLRPWCPELNLAMLTDLLTPDVQPKSETYGDERTGVRKVSVPALVTREQENKDDRFDGQDEQLVIQLVELVVGPDWMVTCWHPSRILRSGRPPEAGAPLLREPFTSHVAHRWVQDPVDAARPDRPKEAGDLAVYLARSLVATYGASLRMLQRWVSEWEVLFYTTLGDHDDQGDEEPKSLKDAAVEISTFLAIVGEFSRSVTAFRLAGDEMPNDTWFADPDRDSEQDDGAETSNEQAKALSAAVDAASEKLEHLYNEIRADMDLLTIQSQARQQEASERLQGYLGKVTGLILVPTFVAGLFGANTALPGQGSWAGFDLMLVLMIVSGAVSYWVIRRIMS